MMRLCAICLAALLLTPGCYLSHTLSTERDASARVDAGARIDAGARVDAARSDAGLPCDMTKLRTHGLVEPWARGSQCDLLVACLDTSEAIELARMAYPDLVCRDAPDAACRGAGRSACLANVGTLSDAEYDAACALTLRSDVAALVCSGDL